MQKNSVNKAIIAGRIGQKPELKYLPSGSAAVNISVATSETWKDNTGQQKDHTEWHRCSIFGKTAEFVANYLNQGDMVYVEGRIRTRSWEDKDGIKRYTTEINVDVITPLGSKSQSSQQQGSSAPQGGGQNQNQKFPPQQGGGQFGGSDDEHGDLPF
jgi:single-strand DNA-binding protein